MTSRHASAITFSILTTLAACDSAQTPSRAFQLRDSLGIEIITNHHEERVLSAGPALRMGVVEGDPDLQFDRVRSIAVDSLGGVWVADSHESLRYYDPAGGYAGKLGRAGRGPGEGTGYGKVTVADGTVLAVAFPGVLQLFTPDGTLLDSRKNRTEHGAIINPLGRTLGQWVILLERLAFGGSPVSRRRVHVAVGPALTGPLDTVADFAGQLDIRHGREVGRASYFAGNPSFAIDGRGRLFVSDSLEYRIGLYDMGGHLRRIVTRAVPPRGYQSEWATEIEEAVAATLRGDANRPVNPAELERIVRSTVPPHIPEHLPFIQRLLVAPNGSMWVERADRHPRPAFRAVAHAFGYVRHAWRPEWVTPLIFDVFAPAGEYRGTVELPHNFAPMATTGDRVYGVYYDELGVEYIVSYVVDDAALKRTSRS